ncbi:hypothetical protein HKX48_002058 [Thoreauomyces humboldtii]|nr:hypothetical protein HKX48_002058 [Thoreauomyces humboldtii]
MAAVVLDEAVCWGVEMGVEGARVVALRGRPCPVGTKGDDCVICLGTGLGDELEEEKNEEDVPHGHGMQSFCKIPHHVAHVSCMMKLYMMRRYGKKCPVCRRKLRVEVVTDIQVAREMGFFKGGSWILRRRWQPRASGQRSFLTVGCMIAVIAAVEAARRIRLVRAKSTNT